MGIEVKPIYLIVKGDLSGHVFIRAAIQERDRGSRDAPRTLVRAQGYGEGAGPSPPDLGLVLMVYCRG